MNIQRNPNSPRVLGIRPLTAEDLAALQAKSARQVLKSLRDSHHNVARLFAAGLRLHEVAAQCGMSISRLSVIRRDPAMEELVARYRATTDEAFRARQDEIAASQLRAYAKTVRQMEDHLDAADEAGELLPVSALAKLADHLGDRTGYVKKQVNININANFAERLEAAIRRGRKVIEGEAA